MGATGLVKAVPELVDMARRIYETENIGFRALAERVGIEYPRLFTLAKRQGWVKYAAFVHDVAQQVGDEIMAEAMKRKRRPGRPVNGKREFKPSGVPGAKRPRTSLTPLQQKVQQARALYESGEGGSKAEIARKLGIGAFNIYRAAIAENWQDPRIKKANISFLIPPPSVDKAKAQLEITLSAIRSMLAVRQINQLDDFEELIGKLGHLLKVYLDPHSYTDLTGLDHDAAAAKLAEVQRLALRQLCPTDKDTLSGTLKGFTDALMRSIELKRVIAGLNKVPLPDETTERVDGESRILEMDSLSTDELRVVQNGMELLERRHRERHALPMPPAPDSLDDLLGPEAQVIEPEVPR